MNNEIRNTVETLLSICLQLNAAGAVDAWARVDPWGSVCVDLHPRGQLYKAGGDHQKILGADIRFVRNGYDSEDFEAITIGMLNALIERIKTYLPEGDA